MLAVVVSRADSASEHIGERLLEIEAWTEHEDPIRPGGAGGGTYYRANGVELRTFDALHLSLDGAAAAFADPTLLVFASRHSGETGPLLTAHATGNFGKAEYGGGDGSLARAAPNALRRVRNALEKYAPYDYDVGVECTHHGPSSVGCPSLFVEVGSGEREWADSAAAEAVARAILDLRGVDSDGDRAVVGFGGGHYAPRFDRVLTDTDWGVGHIAADWSLEELQPPTESQAVIAKAFVQSDTEYALVDGEYPELERVIDDLGFETVSETWLRETTGVPLDLVERAETTAGSIDDGLRFGARASEFDGSLATETLDDELLAEANGIDRAAVVSALEARTVAYGTTEGGSMASGQLVLDDATTYREVVEAMATVLERKYDTVVVTDEEVVARRDAFDPELAREAGVPEGPAFGTLASGSTVEVGGKRVEPEDVRRARERRFHV